jgi:hypothetical protein
VKKHHSADVETELSDVFNADMWGGINSKAPALAEGETLITAHVVRVCEMLCEIREWPSWNPA